MHASSHSQASIAKRLHSLARGNHVQMLRIFMSLTTRGNKKPHDDLEEGKVQAKVDAELTVKWQDFLDAASKDIAQGFAQLIFKKVCQPHKRHVPLCAHDLQYNR